MVVYNIFIYQTGSGILLWKRSFEQNIKDEKLELFSSFFSAIKSFVKELVSEKSDQTLKNIEMGNYIINNTQIKKLGADIVIIADQTDEIELLKIIPKIIGVLKNHAEIIKTWDGTVHRLKVLDYEILELLRKESDLLDTAEISEEEERNIFEEQKVKYLKEYNFLHNRFDKVKAFPHKLAILNQMQRIAELVNDTKKIERIEECRKRMNSEMDLLMKKVSIYLAEAKECISDNFKKIPVSKSLFDLAYREAYINLYSFANKIRLLGNQQLAEKYIKVAKLLIDKPPEIKEDFKSILEDIMDLPDDPHKYIIN
ncbi:MAG: hypothetical protein BAJALOKI1v1_600003 [Promethearchaeota archaeon]|nr:MAG: hypothetical protein BAJALOKI1v1_600003 [Candidatus Lokiarchaeota archaeon]